MPGFYFMGKVFKPEDVVKRKKVIEQAVRDLVPEIGEPVKQILESWKGKESESKLIRLLGEQQARQILKKAKVEDR